MQPYGSLWVLMLAYGFSWVLIGPYASLFFLMGAYRSLCVLVYSIGTYGSLRVLMDSSVILWDLLRRISCSGYRTWPCLLFVEPGIAILCIAARHVDLSKSLGGSNLITRTFLAKFRKFCLHCLYIVDFVCYVRTSQ